MLAGKIHILAIVFFIFNNTVPSSAPEFAIATGYSSTAISIQWKGVPIKVVNGEPLGYKLKVYTDNTLITVLNAPFLENNYLIDRDLKPSTSYIIQVCPYNNAGVGPCQRASATTKPSGNFLFVYDERSIYLGYD